MVASAVEPYIGSLCTGITQSYFVPPGWLLDPTLPPLMAPFVLQSVSEFVVGLIVVDGTPQYLPTGCLTAQRKLQCSIFHLKPYLVDATAHSALTNVYGASNPLYVPSYPSYDTCTTYANECAEIISVFPSVGVDCDLQLPGPVSFFPKTTQVARHFIHNALIILKLLYSLTSII